MFCSKCGTKNADNAKFCSKCGAKMEVAAPVTEPVQPVQPMAAPVTEPVQPVQPMAAPVTEPVQPVQPMAAPVTEPVQPVPPMAPPVPPAAPEKPKKKGNTAVKIVIIILVVLLLAAAGFLAFRLVTKGMNDKKISEQLQTAEEYLNDSDFESAIEAYLTLLDMDEGNEDAINGLTDAYLGWSARYVEAGNYDAAIALLESADSRASKKKISAALSDAESAKTAYEEELALQKEKEEKEEAERLAEEQRKKVRESLENYMANELAPSCGFVDMSLDYPVSYVRFKTTDVESYYTRENEETFSERIWDYAGLLDADSKDYLFGMIAQAEIETGCDIVLVIINESLFEKYGVTEYTDENWQACMEQYANDFYAENGYGFNKVGGDGIILVDNWYDGESGMYIETYGKMADICTLDKIDVLLDRLTVTVVQNPARAYWTFVDYVWMEALSQYGHTYVCGGSVEGAEGILNYDIRDYDGDGQDEMLVLMNTGTLDSYGDCINVVTLRMYESDGTSVTLMSETGALQQAFGGCDAEEDHFYISEKDGQVYIAVDCQKVTGMLADGVYMGIGLWKYDGSNFQTLVVNGVSGSDFYENTEFADTASELRKYGFSSTASAIDDGSYSNFAYDEYGDGLELLFQAEGQNPYLYNYSYYIETEDYKLWWENNDPAGLGQVTFRFSVY